jgi:energy-coupling factor transporter ATP-binding protein EcfA2/DNA-directed RNA polymerase subunit F
MYEALLTELEALRRRTARFRRVTLHLHSPDSKDWARGGDKEANSRDKFFEEGGASLFLSELRPHFDLVGVTDHMKCGYGCKLSQAAASDNECIVLPGMEVNFRPDAALGSIRIHLIVVLPEGATKEHFAKILPPSIPSDAQRTGNEDVEGVDIREFTRSVRDLDGICIAAHVESEQGIRKRFRQTAVETLKLFSDGDEADLEKDNAVSESLREYLIESGIDAVEIHSADKSCHYRWESKKNNKTFWMPTLLTSDAHCVEDFARKDRVTHIKMTHRTIQGLKDALSFPETRIRFPDNLPAAPNPRLLGIQIKGNDESFFEDTTIAFAENLNCLIGVRGSGKSTVVEALRYAFGYNRTLSEVGKSLEGGIRAMQQANLPGCTVRVVYRTTGEHVRILQATYDPKEDYSAKVYSSSGDFIDVPNVEKSGDYPLRLYGWSEIETLGREPSKQRDLLDKLVPEIAPAIERKNDIRAQLRTNRTVIQQNIQEVKNAYGANDGAIRRFREYKADFDKQNTSDVKSIFSALDVVNEKKALLTHLKTNAQSVAGELQEMGTLSVQSDLKDMLKAGSQELRDWWYGEESKRLNISATEQDIQKLLKQVVDSLKSFIALTTDHAAECDEKIVELQKELKEKFSEDDSMQRIADLRANADKRLKAVSSLRQDYQKQWKALIDALVARKDISARLEQVQNEIAGIRAKNNAENERTMNAFLPERMKVTIDFRPGRDTDEFKNILYKVFTNKSKQLKSIQRVILEHVTPIECARMMGTGDFSKLTEKTVNIDSEDFVFGREEGLVCVGRTSAFEDDKSADVKILSDSGSRLSMILDVQETPWDDYETILLNGGPVNEKSPGQRSSAMLPLIALAERTPLIIDQPEDNLDKRLIGSVLKQVLAKLKEQRQIIVCTHDPNILVGGDAEQVIVLDAVSDKKGKVSAHGSIDNDDIVETVIELLEGGADAFRSRSRRYRGRAGLE